MDYCQPCRRTANWNGSERPPLYKSPAFSLPGNSHPLLFNPEEPKSILFQVAY